MTDAEIENAALRAKKNDVVRERDEAWQQIAALRAEVEELDQQGELMTRDRDAWRETAYEREREAENLRAEVEYHRVNKAQYQDMVTEVEECLEGREFDANAYEADLARYQALVEAARKYRNAFAAPVNPHAAELDAALRAIEEGK